MTQEQIYRRKLKIAQFCFVLLVLITSFGFWQAINKVNTIRMNKKHFYSVETDKQGTSNIYLLGGCSEE